MWPEEIMALNILQGTFTGYKTTTLNLILMYLYDLHKQTRPSLTQFSIAF